MMSIRAMNDMAQAAAFRAAKAKKVPYRPYDAEEVRSYIDRFPFPLLGNYRPNGWELVQTVLVDTTGCGTESEPALTQEQLRNLVLNGLDNDYGYAVICSGQFQTTLGIFKEDKGHG